MKKLGMLALAVILVQGLVFSAPAPKTQTNAWKKLDKVRMIPHIRTYVGKTKKVKARYEGATVIEMASIRTALEEAGVDETVALELRYNHKLITKLGTYSPTVTMKDGKKVVTFASIPLGLRIFGSLRTLGPDYFDGFDSDSPERVRFSPHHLKLYFKNAKNKTKARVCVSFL